MRIALRTSGGRGEYEIAGEQGQLHASDLFDKEITYQLRPGLLIPGRSHASRVQGKPRIRLSAGGGAAHLYRVLCGALLLPKAIRELARTPDAALQIRGGQYSIASIQVDIVEVGADAVTLQPTSVMAINRSEDVLELPVVGRLHDVFLFWSKGDQEGPLAELSRLHKEAVESGDHLAIERVARQVQQRIGRDDDVLPIALRELGCPASLVRDAGSRFTAIRAGMAIDEVVDDEDAVEPVEAKLRLVREWRVQACRGSEGDRFRRAVRAAYGDTCLFSGVRLPKTPVTESAGVDAAHILPWSCFEVAAVSNGLCLSKQCHWAFDSGVLRLDYLADQDAYRLTIPDRVREIAEAENLDLGPFEPLEGIIPVDRLPVDRQLWPRPEFLQELNTRLYGD